MENKNCDIFDECQKVGKCTDDYLSCVIRQDYMKSKSCSISFMKGSLCLIYQTLFRVWVIVIRDIKNEFG
jgi:hypothetical protein